MVKSVCAVAVALAVFVAQHAVGQERPARESRPNFATGDPSGRGPAKPAPTHANYAYGDHERNVLDFWQAKSEGPTPLFVWYHGGGFRGGDKNSVPAELLTPLLEAGVSVAAANYRLSDVAPYPAQLHDCARALQTLRAKAKEWNLDPTRVAAAGGSAGSGISQWLAFRDDMAQPDAADPVARQSTRLTCVLPLNMQCTYDPREIKKIVPGDAYKHPALPPFFGCPEGWDWDKDAITPELDAILKDSAPITHLTADDPPTFIYCNAGAEQVGNIHHPNFGRHLAAAMEKLGIEHVFRLDSDYPSTDASYADMRKFMLKHFKMEAAE